MRTGVRRGRIERRERRRRTTRVEVGEDGGRGRGRRDGENEVVGRFPVWDVVLPYGNLSSPYLQVLYLPRELTR
jgi:hypothetical protein